MAANKAHRQFVAKKARILEQLGQSDYTDLSPKGSVDEGVLHLVDLINGCDVYVTTSSCAGRIAVYRDGGLKAADSGDEDASTAGPLRDEPASSAGMTYTSDIIGSSGAKGGGAWLFTSHDPVSLVECVNEGDIYTRLGLDAAEAISAPPSGSASRFVHLKYEPLVSIAEQPPLLQT